MYIDKWWYDFIGGSDDSLTLLDYFGSTQEEEYSISKILEDFHISSRETAFFRGSPPVFYTGADGMQYDIDFVIDLIQDLSAIALESLKSGKVNLGDLAKDDSDKTFKVICNKVDFTLLIRILTDFANAPQNYAIAEMVGEEDILEIAKQCAEIAEELKGFEEDNGQR